MFENSSAALSFLNPDKKRQESALEKTLENLDSLVGDIGLTLKDNPNFFFRKYKITDVLEIYSKLIDYLYYDDYDINSKAFTKAKRLKGLMFWYLNIDLEEINPE